MSFEAVKWASGEVILLDQRKLPTQEIYIRHATWQAVALGIKEMVVRGAPAIGVAAGYGIALAAAGLTRPSLEGLRPAFEGLAATRPTAVNLFWALDRMKAKVEGGADAAALLAEAHAIKEEDLAMCRAMGEHGAGLLPEGARVLTHCNAGALATAGYGTALGVIRSAWASGRLREVYADETRPFLQGARLTAWELHKDQIPVRVITDNMAAHLMSRGEIDAVIVGTDRVAANGDVANKIGTYGLAILARYHQIPFYVVGPSSTLDAQTPSGREIPIEARPSREVTHVGETQIVPDGVGVLNPAFDVTPAALISAIITEKGIARAPYAESLKGHF
ncbi:S-methyl-5-thioribose-1-phosphate isomerase [Myxococcota bacterium]|nr:S-methyl-5-thioribose-1-phosphate isomerase [Myxococcota bacterium]